MNERVTASECPCVCVFSSSDRLGEGGQNSQRCSSHVGRKKVKVEKEMGTRGSDGVHREVADSKRKISKKR